MNEMFLLFLAAALGHGSATAKEPIESRARWACSAYITPRLAVPGSVEWTRRSQWPAVEVKGVWVVRARLTSKNRMGVTLPATLDCAMKYDARSDAWVLLDVKKAPAA